MSNSVSAIRRFTSSFKSGLRASLRQKSSSIRRSCATFWRCVAALTNTAVRAFTNSNSIFFSFTRRHDTPTLTKSDGRRFYKLAPSVRRDFECNLDITSMIQTPLHSSDVQCFHCRYVRRKDEDYSYLNARIGSDCIARWAGTKTESIATSRIPTVTATSMGHLSPFSPNSWLAARRFSP